MVVVVVKEEEEEEEEEESWCQQIADAPKIAAALCANASRTSLSEPL